MDIEPSTVQTHQQKIYQTLEVSNHTEAVVFFYKNRVNNLHRRREIAARADELFGIAAQVLSRSYNNYRFPNSQDSTADVTDLAPPMAIQNHEDDDQPPSPTEVVITKPKRKPKAAKPTRETNQKRPSYELPARAISDDVRVSSFAIRSARELIRILPPQLLGKFEQIMFSLPNEQTLRLLLEQGLISDEDFATNQAGVVGTAAYMAISKIEKAKDLLTGPQAKKNLQIFSASVLKELLNQAGRKAIHRA